MRTDKFWSQQSGLARGLCYAAVLLIVLTSTAQAAHFCGVRVGTARSIARVEAISAGSALCLTCLMTQSAAVAPLAMAFSSVLRPDADPVIPVACLHTLQPSFHLYVRPPPFI